MSEPGEIGGLDDEEQILRSAILELTNGVDRLASSVDKRDGTFESALRASRPSLALPPAGTSRGPLADIHRALAELAQVVQALVHSAAPARQRREEIAASGQLQRRLVQPGDLDLPGAAIRPWSRRRSECSSDWWSARPSADGGCIVVLGDVGGHGVGAALVSAVLYGALELAFMGMPEQLRPPHLLRALNRALHEAGSSGLRSCAISLSIANGGTELRLANAGHDAPAYRAFGQWGVLRCERGPVLGEQRSSRYAELVLPVDRGDRIVLFTNGVSRVEDAGGNELGADAIYAACGRIPPDATADEVRDELGELVSTHAGSRPLTDDATLLVVEISRP